MKKFILYNQLDAMDCGPACLRMIFRYHGSKVNRETIRSETQLGKTGTSLLSLSEAAKTFGFSTFSAKLTFEQLIEDATLPCILYWDRYHFVVLTPQSTEKKLVVADPAKGIITYTKEEFLKSWLIGKDDGIQKGIALLLSPGPDFVRRDDKDRENGWALLKRYTRVYRKQLFFLLFGLVLGSLIQLAFPYLTQGVVDKGIGSKDLTLIQLFILGQLMLLISQSAIEFIRAKALMLVSTKISLWVLSDFWTKLMKLPLHFFDSRQTGDILQRISDHRRVELFVTGTALQTLFSCFNLIVFSILLITYNLSVFAMFAVGSILYAIYLNFFLEKRKKLDYARFSLSSRESSMTVQLISGMHEIKLNNAEHRKKEDWHKIRTELFDLNFKALKLDQYQQGGALLLNQGKNLLITFIVAKLVVDGSLTLGAMMAIQYIIAQLSGPTERLAGFTQQAQDTQLSLERMREVYEMPDENEGKSLNLTEYPGDDEITFEDVTFTYPGVGNDPVLHNINLTFPAGKTTAIVGMSGSGKTTLLKLIQKFYDNYSGRISVGVMDIRDLSPQYWRSISGSVMQEGFIFSDTIANNITISSATPDEERLRHACKVANILKFIESLPMKFNTIIGADGNGISSGQKQRILIARAVYKDPTFILFDEATNSLDSSNEQEIMKNLSTFFRQRTSIIVAHRLSTVREADKIIVLEHGRVIEEGDHETLLAIKGKYFTLVKNQLELDRA